MFSFCKHKWSKWSEIISCYSFPRQFKYCEKCNKIVGRRVAFTSNEVNCTLWNHKPE
jgi:hypothetical protein